MKLVRRPIQLLVVFATKTEAEPFLKAVSAKKVAKEAYFLHQFALSSGEDMGLICCCGVGRAAAEEAIKQIFLKYQPVYVVNAGLAGALACDLNVGDFVVVDSVMNKNIAQDQEGEEAVLSVQTGVWPSEYPLALLTVDQALTDDKLRDELAHYGHVVDMEAYPIVQMCVDFSVPCFVLKIVSDRANSEASRDFAAQSRVLAQKLAEFLVEYIDVLGSTQHKEV